MIYSLSANRGLSAAVLFEQYKIGHQTSRRPFPVPEGMQIFIKSMKFCRDDHRMDLPGVQDLLGALQQAGTCFISCSWSPNIVSPAHMSTVVYSPGWTVFHRIGSCKRGYVPSAAGGFPSGVPRSAACPNSSEDIHKPGNDPGFQMPPARSCLWGSCPALFFSRCGSRPLKNCSPL